MTFLKSKILWSAVLISVTVVGLMRGEPGEDSREKQITRLIEQLGDGRFRTRELASVALEKLGEPALPALRRAAGAKDLEIRVRAEALIGKIMRSSRISKSTGLETIVVKPGTYLMGSPPNESGRRTDELQHRVRITMGILLGKREVMQEEYQKVMKTNPSWFAATGTGKSKVRGQKTNRFPVENVSWFDALEFCNRLSKMDGYKPYYELKFVERKDNSIIEATVTVLGGNGYRLPTEAEWEYACRAGTTNRFYYGSRTAKQNANVKAMTRRGGYGIVNTGWRSPDRTTKIGTYVPNPWGFYDMHGNVGEWCWDAYDKDYYRRSPATDPKGPPTSNHRVVRGGSWLVYEDSCRSASRFFITPGQKSYVAGFRVARSP